MSQTTVETDCCHDLNDFLLADSYGNGRVRVEGNCPTCGAEAPLGTVRGEVSDRAAADQTADDQVWWVAYERAQDLADRVQAAYWRGETTAGEAQAAADQAWAAYREAAREGAWQMKMSKALRVTVEPMSGGYLPWRAYTERRQEMIVNTGTWCQATVSTGTVGIRTATSVLRRLGYKVSISNMGRQVTPVGVVKMTLINVALGTQGSQSDTWGVTEILAAHIPELRKGA